MAKKIAKEEAKEKHSIEELTKMVHTLQEGMSKGDDQRQKMNTMISELRELLES